MPSKIKKLLSLLGELLASLPRSASSLFLLGGLIFLSIVFLTPDLEKVFGVWKSPIQLTLTLIYLYYFCVSFAKIFYPSYRADGGMKAATLARAEPKTFLPEELYKRYAIHEAAHLITYALYDNLPDKLTAKVNDFRSFPNGTVSFNYETPQTTKKYYENLMLTYLAGYCSEYILLDGDNHIGSQQDNIDWEYAAKTYLSSFDHDYLWFSQPQNEAEARTNASTLKELKNSQIQVMEEIIKLNKELIHSISRKLMLSDELKTRECFELLEVVNLVPNATI